MAKRNILLFLAAGLMTGIAPAHADHVTTVVGLVNLTNYQAALLVMTDSPPNASFSMDTHKWVTDGEVLDDMQIENNHTHVEIAQIDFTNGVVRAKENGVSVLYVPPQTNSPLAFLGTGFRLDNAAFDDALDFYAGTTGRTVLVHPDVNRGPLSISADVHNKLEVAGSIEKKMQQQGVVMMADGEKFEWVVPARLAASLSPVTEPPVKGSSSTNVIDALPTGSINFINVPLPQALEVYQALTASKWVQDKPLTVPVAITFHNQTPLTKAEVLHVFRVLLAWHGLAIVNLDDQSFKLVPMATGK